MAAAQCRLQRVGPPAVAAVVVPPAARLTTEGAIRLALTQRAVTQSEMEKDENGKGRVICLGVDVQSCHGSILVGSFVDPSKQHRMLPERETNSRKFCCQNTRFHIERPINDTICPVFPLKDCAAVRLTHNILQTLSLQLSS